MTTNISIHHAYVISADAGGTMGAPMSIRACPDAFGHGNDVTFFTGDHNLSRKLAEAINATVREHNAELASVEPAPVEGAA